MTELLHSTVNCQFNNSLHTMGILDVFQSNSTAVIQKTKSATDYDKLLDDLRDEFYRRFRRKNNSSSTATLTDFIRIKTLGGGSFGQVILVKHKISNDYYAMKVMEKQRIYNLKRVTNILYEKEILKSISFPFVVYLEYSFKDNIYLYLVMPYVCGGELFQLLRRMDRINENLARFYAAQVVLTLEYLHHCKLVYRDLKPENILIDESGYIKLTDFGFCKIVEGRAWTLCGTPEYLAPEVIANKGYGRAVDWWAFGVLLYEMAAGYPPFHSQDPLKNYEKILAGKFTYAPNFSLSLRDLIRNLLQVDTSRRLGNLKNGVSDIKNHNWFKDIVWWDVYNRKIEPPYRPKVKGPEDTSYFENLPELKLKSGSTNVLSNVFKDF